ncbi:ATP-binding cassette domain-containing protein [Rhodovibrio salinarum]|uniref:Sugar ABC transporter ATP-binding protein n=1 Tax=Rhodovibrio salinarum TaxID=1087 RepID=A0A934QGQ7_9PROT|nr:ATP-binding cassette domain-containing protein [Rhodovibrio salinarum]MBK1696210.1 sugar ABC transporter ATP-binding protein [Rhodovibrio salinarum]
MALLEMTGIEKHFGGVTALNGVDFETDAGEVMALVGDNGAGKSTLIKTIAGAHQPDAGTIRLQGKDVFMRSPQDAWKLGIATIFQELALADKMNVPDNIFLGQELRRSILGIPFLDRKRMRQRTRELLTDLEVQIQDLDLTVEAMSGGQRQGIAIARALNLDADLIIMDEPTAALAVAEVRKVLDFIQHLRAQGKGVILISHNIQDVFAVADRVTVMRQGQVEAVRRIDATTPEEVIALITGARAVDLSHRPAHNTGGDAAAQPTPAG